MLTGSSRNEHTFLVKHVAQVTEQSFFNLALALFRQQIIVIALPVQVNFVKDQQGGFINGLQVFQGAVYGTDMIFVRR